MGSREKVINLYKTLYFMGKEYPKGKEWFHPRLKNAFIKNKDIQDPEQIDQLVKRGEFVVKELEALYKLKKYRTMKNRYYEADPP